MHARTVVIAGASGLVGGRCLAHLLEHPDVGRVVSLGRRALDVKHAKLEQRTVDFARLDVESIPKDVEDAHCALGTTMKKAGSREAFVAVDKDAVLAFARATRARGARRFVLVSSLGADARALSFYLRVKGETEQAVGALGFDVVHVLRPSMLDGERAEARSVERMGLGIMRALAPVLGGIAPIHVDVVGRAMVRLAFSDRFGICVHPSKAIASVG